jgi:MFS family permease
MAAFGIGILLAPILGPTLGGWITDNYKLALDLLSQPSGRRLNLC